MSLWLLAVLLLAATSRPTACSQILAVLPIPVYSHTVPFLPVLSELAARGHQVTLISPYRSPDPAVRNIHMNFTLADLQVELIKVGAPLADPRKLVGFWYETGGMDMCSEISVILTHQLKPLLPDPKVNKYHLIIAELFFCQETVSALGHIFKAPVVSKHPGPVTPSVAYTLGNPTLTSYTPHIRLIHSDQMGLLQRTWNFLISTSDELQYNVWMLPKLDKTMRETFSDVPDLPYIKDLLKETALLMTETHFALNYPRPYSRNILEIGGMGTSVQEPLPEDLEKFLNDSEAGVIYMSWGSHFKSEELNSTLSVLMKVFSQLEQRVLFKWHTDLPDRPSNVLIRDWFPQNTVLAHAKVVLYISHCGLNSIYEAGYHGVPVLATPIFVDQPHNALILQELGMAEVVDIKSLNDMHHVLKTIRKLLSTPSYSESARKRSGMMRERPVPLLTEIVGWMEYVMKFGGEGLRPAASSLPWYSLYQLDVLFLLTAVLVSLLLILLRIVSWICRSCRPTSTSDKKRQ